MVNFGKMLKSAGHTIKKGSNSIGHVFEASEKKAEKVVSQVYKDSKGAVGQVYKDGRSAASYTGKHVVQDVDNLTNALSSPILWLVAGGVVLVVLTRK